MNIDSRIAKKHNRLMSETLSRLQHPQFKEHVSQSVQKINVVRTPNIFLEQDCR